MEYNHFIDLLSDPELDMAQRVPIINRFLKKEIKLTSKNDTYTLEKYLASGSYGDVFRAVNTKGKFVAVKITKSTDESIREVLNYIHLSKKCEQYLVSLYESFVNSFDNTLWLVQVQELMDGSINTIKLNHISTCKLLVFLLNAIKCLHMRGIAHMDIRRGNIFYNEKSGFKLGDLGLACLDRNKKLLKKEKYESLKSCRFFTSYIPPKYKDYFEDMPINFDDAQTIDLWAIGVVIYRQFASLGYYNKNIANKLCNTTMRDDENSLRADDKVPVTIALPEDSPIPKLVFENVMGLLLYDYEPTTASKILEYLNRNIDAIL